MLYLAPGFRGATAAAVLAFLAACSGSDNSPPQIAVQPGPVTPTELAPGDPLPGIVVAIEAITGGTGPGGSFEVGDRVSVDFSLRKNDGSAWRIDDFTSGGIMVSGPTFNYQRVIPSTAAVLTESVLIGEATYRFTFGDPLPSRYEPPLNDTASFGASDGEMAGRELMAGTYTVGLYLGWNYTVEGESFRDGGDATADFLFGGATSLVSRDVVGQANCNQCHDSLRAHGGIRRSVGLCILCHTSGSEDRNTPTAANGTPGVSVDFRVLVHKIHNGAHLPSVHGVTTNTDGSRNYDAPPKKYEVVGFRDRVHDFSHVGFPVWPNGMPRDQGYSALAMDSYRDAEDAILDGVTACHVCHGDPDGAGPIGAPSQGQLAYTQPSRRACGSCHDDVDWNHPYTANNSTMPAQGNDASCLLCHGVVNSALEPEFAHRHPLHDVSFNRGMRVELTGVAEAGVHDNDGRIDRGEKVAVTFRVTDDAGIELSPPPASISLVLSGPTANDNLVLRESIPTSKLSGPQPYTVLLPRDVRYERVGVGTANPNDVFTTTLAPHWDTAGAVTSVFVRTATAGGDSTLSAAVTLPSNWIDVVDPTGFARNDVIAVDDGSGDVEFLQIASVLGNRIWFTSTPLQREHPPGAAVREVTLTARAAGVDYTLDASLGTIMETGGAGFAAGEEVIVTYTTDFVMPQQYPLALNDSPGLNETSGKWAGKPVVDGTYAVTLWSAQTLTLARLGESNRYRNTAPGVRFEFLVGDTPVALQPYSLIASESSCTSCHQDVLFHGGGRRGYATCVACHGTSGCEDRPQYVAPMAPATDGVTVNFRTMLHKIHMGSDLTNASAYTVVGFGSSAYPSNFTPHHYDHVAFPVMPGGAVQCAKCHGEQNTAWHEPRNLDHPSAQVRPVLSWRAVCGSCHDSSAAQAHIEVQTSMGGHESCAVCHGRGREWAVDHVHRAR